MPFLSYLDSITLRVHRDRKATFMKVAIHSFWPRPQRSALVILILFMTTVPGRGDSTITEVIQERCVGCHNSEEPNGGLDITNLPSDMSDLETARKWIQIHDRVASGEMPPESEEKIPVQLINTFTQELAVRIETAESRRKDVVLRRLNQSEYENTIRDLFEVNVSLREYLPKDNSIDGFDNVGEGLAISAEAIQSYLRAADVAIDAILGSDKPPQKIVHVTNLLDQKTHDGKPQLESQIGKMFRKTDDGIVIFQSGYCPTNLVNFARLRAPAGTYRGTMRIRAIQSDDPVILRVYGGDTIVGRRENHLVGFFEALPNQWKTIEFTDVLVESGGTFQPKCYGTRDTRKDADTYPEPGIEIGEITIEGPLDPWPPKSRGVLLGEIIPEQAGVSELKEIITRIAPQAFRRPASQLEIESILDLPIRQLDSGRSFLDSLRTALKDVLCSPQFLFLDESHENHHQDNPSTSKVIGPHSLASRLSYFLWSSSPDSKLQELATTGAIMNSSTLVDEVRRMLKDDRADALTENFMGQWLSLRDIDFTSPDAELYPEFDELLRQSMIDETKAYFRYMLNENRRLIECVDSDYTFINQRLAEHYGIDDVKGLDLRKVSLPPDSVRGGFLTQASILKVTANGSNTSPVTRGVWVLERFLDRPTPPPPSGVAAVEPDIRGAVTVRQQLEQHRSDQSCASCHRWIDPPGFALENFDAIGGWRSHYRTLGEGVRPSFPQDPHTFAWIRYRYGLPVDASGVTVNGDPFDDIQSFKNLLAEHEGTISRCITKKLLTYSLGRRLGFSDRTAIQLITNETMQQGGGLRTLIENIVVSDIFRTP